MRLVPALALEPPHAYVDFVATHLEPLRAQAASVVGGDEEAEQLYPDVLTDVAARWRWLRWRTWLSRREAADSYLRRSEEHTSELQSPDTISYAVFCLKKKKIR